MANPGESRATKNRGASAWPPPALTAGPPNVRRGAIFEDETSDCRCCRGAGGIRQCLRLRHERDHVSLDPPEGRPRQHQVGRRDDRRGESRRLRRGRRTDRRSDDGGPAHAGDGCARPRDRRVDSVRELPAASVRHLGRVHRGGQRGRDELLDGVTATGELQMPSFAQSGLKVNMAEGSLELSGDQEILLVDFDVRQSFGHDAAGDRWVMHPVITGGELGATGGVHVTIRNGTGVTFALGTATLSLTDMNGTPIGTPLTPTDGDGDGVFEVDFGLLAPGSYRVLVNPPQGVTLTVNPAVPFLVTVTSGQAAEVGLTVTAAS